MSEKIVQLNEEIIKGQIRELVRGSVEETLNELLDGLRQIAPYVIVDCGSYIANDILSAAALIHCIKALHAICSFALSE